MMQSLVSASAYISSISNFFFFQFDQSKETVKKSIIPGYVYFEKFIYSRWRHTEGKILFGGQ